MSPHSGPCVPSSSLRPYVGWVVLCLYLLSASCMSLQTARHCTRSERQQTQSLSMASGSFGQCIQSFSSLFQRFYPFFSQRFQAICSGMRSGHDKCPDGRVVRALLELAPVSCSENRCRIPGESGVTRFFLLPVRTLDTGRTKRHHMTMLSSLINETVQKTGTRRKPDKRETHHDITPQSPNGPLPIPPPPLLHLPPPPLSPRHTPQHTQYTHTQRRGRTQQFHRGNICRPCPYGPRQGGEITSVQRSLCFTVHDGDGPRDKG